MSVKASIAATLLLFVLFVAYGFGAMTIPMFPGQEFEPFKPRTMPMLLALTGVALCIIRIVQLLRAPRADSAIRCRRIRMETSHTSVRFDAGIWICDHSARVRTCDGTCSWQPDSSSWVSDGLSMLLGFINILFADLLPPDDQGAWLVSCARSVVGRLSRVGRNRNRFFDGPDTDSTSYW